MDSNRVKNASQWFYNTVFREEAIRPRPQAAPSLPAPLRAARALETGTAIAWQSREVLFIKQARLLADFADDQPYTQQVVHYYPTYQSLTDPELRGYLTWRGQLRRGDVQKTSLTFAFLYIYELLNQIGVADPLEGYHKLTAFRDAYSPLDLGITLYLDQWLMDYVVYYNLDPALLENNRLILRDRYIACLTDIPSQPDARIAEAITALAPKWLSRSKFYAANSADMDKVIAAVVRRMADHYARRSKHTFAEQYFGSLLELPVRLFESAVFHDRMKTRSCEYTASPIRHYSCKSGLWTVRKYSGSPRSAQKLEDLLKTIDAVMRRCCGYRHPIKAELEVKWITKLIEEETAALLAAKKAEQDRLEAEKAKKLTIDPAHLQRIRQDAAVTRDRLVTQEELQEDDPQPIPQDIAQLTMDTLPVEEPAPDSPLSPEEYRLLQCLLYGRPLDWVRAEGLLCSVLVDSINEKLYDTFADAVILSDEPPELIEDYILDLKEMVHP